MVMSIVLSLLLLFAGIGLLILIHVCLVGRAFRRGFRLNSRATIIEGSITGRRSMSREDIEKLPCFDFKAAKEEKGNSNGPSDCAVCLENFSVGDKCRLLPMCSHSFHAHCVDSWLLKAPVCPICRTGAVYSKKTEVETTESGHVGETGVELSGALNNSSPP